MSEAAPEPELDEDPSVLRAERRLRLLEELAEIGMVLARGLRDQAEVTDSNADAFARLSRAVRLTLALEARTEQELRDLKAGLEPAREDARARAAERAYQDRAQDRDTRHDQVFDLVFDAAKAEIDDHEAFGEVFEALMERMEEDEAYKDLRERPLREIVERLCRDLELTPDWSQWRDDGWAPGYSPARFRFSPFNQPSRRPLRNADCRTSWLWKPSRSRAHALE